MAGNYLDALFGRFYVDGVEQELVGGINVKSPLTATVNNETGALDVSLTIEAAAQVPYDNDASELSAANVQAALDELAAAVDAIGIADVLAVDDDAGGASIEGLGFVGIAAADHETAALTIASGGGGGASSAWSIGSAVPSHAPGVGAHHVRVASSDDSALYVRHAAGWVPYIRGNLNAGRVPYTLNSTGRVASTSYLAFDGTNLSIAAPTAPAHAVNLGYLNGLGGTYTPTLSDVSASLSSASARVSTYIRIGNIVIVFWRAQAQNASSASKSFRMTLPVDPGVNFSTAIEANGSGSMGSSSGVSAVYVESIPSTKVVRVTTDHAGSSGIREWSGSFSYVVS